MIRSDEALVEDRALGVVQELVRAAASECTCMQCVVIAEGGRPGVEPRADEGDAKERLANSCTNPDRVGDGGMHVQVRVIDEHRGPCSEALDGIVDDGIWVHLDMNVHVGRLLDLEVPLDVIAVEVYLVDEAVHILSKAALGVVDEVSSCRKVPPRGGR